MIKNAHNFKKSCDYTSVGQNHRKFLPNAIIMDYISYIQVVQLGNLQFSWDDNHQKYEGVQSLLAYLLDFSEYIITHVHFWPGKNLSFFFKRVPKANNALMISFRSSKPHSGMNNYHNLLMRKKADNSVDFGRFKRQFEQLSPKKSLFNSKYIDSILTIRSNCFLSFCIERSNG